MTERQPTMMTTEKTLRGEVLSPGDLKKLTTQAQQLDREIRIEADAGRKSIIKLGEKIAKMRDAGLWHYLLDQEGRPKYRSLEQHVKSVVGPMASSRYFEIIAAH